MTAKEKQRQQLQQASRALAPVVDGILRECGAEVTVAAMLTATVQAARAGGMDADHFTGMVQTMLRQHCEPDD